MLGDVKKSPAFQLAWNNARQSNQKTFEFQGKKYCTATGACATCRGC